MKVWIYPAPGQQGIETRVEKAVRRLCRARKFAKGVDRRPIPLTGDIVDQLVQKMIYAASHAATRPIPNQHRGRGAPPDNARIILADDVREACRELGISAGLRYSPPESFAVDLFNVLDPIIWGAGGRNPRKTFDRLQRNPITRN